MIRAMLAQIMPLVPVSVGDEDGGADILLADVIAFEQVVLCHRAGVAHCQRIVLHRVRDGPPEASGNINWTRWRTAAGLWSGRSGQSVAPLLGGMLGRSHRCAR